MQQPLQVVHAPCPQCNGPGIIQDVDRILRWTFLCLRSASTGTPSTWSRRPSDVAPDLVSVLRELLDAHRAEAVVDLGRVRRLHRTLERYRSQEPRDQLLALVEAAAAECVDGYASMVLDQVERVVRDHPGETVDALVLRVTGDYWFRRLNRALRRTQAMFGAELPMVQVRAHTRAGRHVSFHHRLVGYGHLAGLPTAGRPEQVGEVLVRLVDADATCQRR